MQGFIQDVLLGGDCIMLGTLGACPIEIMPLEIIELELTKCDSTSAIFKPCIFVFGTQ